MPIAAQEDSAYIEDFRDYGNFSVLLESKVNNVAILNQRANILNISTNNGLPNYGLMFSYKWLNVRLTTSIAGATYADPNRGKTNNFGLAVGYTGTQWWGRAFYEQYEGFHIRNPDEYNPSWFQSNTQYPYLPTLRSQTVYANAYYGLNHGKYSHRAFLWQSQHQRRSAGSWIVGASAGYDHIFSDTSIIPVEADLAFYELRNLTGLESITCAVNIGYTGTIVISDSWSVGLMFAPGVAVTYGVIEELNDVNSYNWDLGAMAEMRGIISYSKNRWYGGLAANSYLITKRIRNDFFANAHSYLQFNVGYRLDMPKSRLLGRIGLSN